jgi:putative lipoic acid-binding regulatory protein
MDIDANTTPLEFPSEQPVKVMGRNSPEFRARMLQVVALHAGPVQPTQVTERLSRDGNYLSLTCTVRAESREHLDRIYRELHATGLVLYAL